MDNNYILMCSKLEEAYGLLKAAMMLSYDPMEGGYSHPEVKEKVHEFIKDLSNHY